MNTSSNVTETVQVIIIDEDNSLYIEKNNKYSDRAFFGGKIKGQESNKEALQRELDEEIKVEIHTSLFKKIDKDTEALSFKQGSFISTFFLFQVTNEFAEEYLNNRDIILKTTLEILESENEKEIRFMPPKDEFLRRVKLALDYKN